MTEKLPNWNLGDFYSSINDEGIDLDLEKYRNFSKSFNKKYKGQLVNQVQNLESIIKEYEDGNELGDKLGNFAFLIYATNMNDQETVQFYQGINEKITVHGLELTVSAIDNRRIDSLIVKKIAKIT